jgi:hypothetical protein
MITTGFDEIASTFHVNADQISFNLVGMLQLTTGSGTFFTAAAAAVWGKRPVIVISIIFLFGTSAWGFFAGVRSSYFRPNMLYAKFMTELPIINLDESYSRFLCRPSRDTYQCDRL